MLRMRACACIHACMRMQLENRRRNMYFENWKENGYRFDIYKKSEEEVRYALLVNAEVEEAIELPDKDILIGFREIGEEELDCNEQEIISYYKLSEIELIRREKNEVLCSE